MAKSTAKETTEKPQEAAEETKVAPKFERKAAVKVPVKKLELNKPAYVRIISEIKKEDTVNEKGEADTIEVGRVNDLENEEAGELSMVFGVVLQKNLEKAYPNSGYVGKCFEIIKRPVEGKRYKDYELYEIDA